MANVKNPNLAELKSRVAKMPTEPGVYRWLNKNKEVLYIGKAKNLKNRLKSYLIESKNGMGPWKQSLMDNVEDIDITITKNELEALILETNLIKEKKPKYNVMMKDGKNYVYIKISTNEPYPNVSVVRKMEDDGAKYFGPFLSAIDTRLIIDTLHLIYNFKEDEKALAKLNTAEKKGSQPINIKPSLYLQIGQSCGVAQGKITKEEYVSRINSVVQFCKGSTKEAKQRATELMKEAAKNNKFEKAAKLRDSISIIESREQKQFASDTSGQNTDCIGIVTLNGRSQAVVLRERGGKIIDEHSHQLKGESETLGEIVKQFLQQYYTATPDIPDTIVVSELIEEAELLMQWLTKRKGRKVEIIVPERGKKAQLLEMAQKNAAEKLKQQEAKWEAAAKNVKKALEELKDVLDLPSIPKRIEGYDISHLGGTETVGSMSVCINGKPANKQYRSFTIKSLKEGDIDDYKALAEMLKRRLKHLEIDIKNEETKLEEKEITFKKGKKSEQEEIESLIIEHCKNVSIKSVNYENFIVGRDKEEIISLSSLFPLNGGNLLFQCLWVSPDYDKELRSFLVRKMLEKAKKEKVYIFSNSEEESFFLDLSFRNVIKPPKSIEDILKKIKGKKPNVLVSISGERVVDSSLTHTPDLLVIDGGKGQLSSITKVLKEMDLKIPVIGLAKREEEIFVPDEKYPISFKKDSEGGFLLMRLRNEAHRFANLHREKRLNKKSIGSVLDDIDGIGPKTRQELLQKFGSVDGIKNANDKELSAILSAEQFKAIRLKL